MSNESSKHEDPDVVRQRDRKSDRQHTMTLLTATNVVLGALVAGFAIAFVYVEFVYEPALDPQLADKYAEVAQQRLTARADAIQAEVAALASETVPPITQEVYAQMKRDYPLYLEVIQDESDVYLQNVEQMFVNKVKAQYHDFLASHKQILREEFPEHASEENVEKVIREFEQTFDRLAERYYIDEFRQETTRTRALWNAFEPLPLPGPNEPSLEEQLADYTADWTLIAVVQEGQPAGAAPPPD